jgi:hypothetical protein
VPSDPIQKIHRFCRLKHRIPQKLARQALGAMSKTLALDFGCVLRTTSALVALGFFPAVLPVQQLLAGGPNLFASSREVGRELDAARALPITAFYATDGLKTNADPGALVRSQPATEYALPPCVAATRILYHTQTASRSRFITHLLSTDAAPPAERSRRTPPEEIFHPGGKNNKYIREFLARDQPGKLPTYGPLLLVGGGDAILFTDSASEKILERLCSAGARVQRNIYPGLGYDPVVFGSLRGQLNWIAARFAGEPASSNCPAP